jgi:hypothetical protein
VIRRTPFLCAVSNPLSAVCAFDEFSQSQITLAEILLVVLREPAPADYLAEVDEVCRNGGVEVIS